jgi:hypothetical protein
MIIEAFTTSSLVPGEPLSQTPNIQTGSDGQRKNWIFATGIGLRRCIAIANERFCYFCLVFCLLLSMEDQCKNLHFFAVR